MELVRTWQIELYSFMNKTPDHINSNNKPLVSIITVYYNTPTDTIEFLESAKKITYPCVEIILVDNSNDETFKQLIKSQYPSVLFVESQINVGFAGGNNLGIARASGKYFLFLNSDTIIFPDSIEPIVEFLERNEHVGLASPKVLFPDGSTIQYAGAKSISPYTGRGKRLGLLETDKGQYDFCKETQLGHGAALIVPKRVVERVGLWPEIYFLYYEEHDWCEQIKKAGYSVYYLGNSKIIHKEGISTGGELSPLKVYYMTRNRLLYMRRNSSWPEFCIGLLFYTLLTIPKSLLVYSIKGQWTLLSSFFKGIIWNLKSTAKTH